MPGETCCQNFKMAKFAAAVLSGHSLLTLEFVGFWDISGLDRFVPGCTFGICASSSHLCLSNVFRRPVVQHVGEPTAQPGFARGSIMLAVNRFMEHVRVMTSEANDLLFQPSAGASH